MFNGSECEFLPNKPEKNGYVRIGSRPVNKRKGLESGAHRRAYVSKWGPIPPGWTVDHECHNADEDCPGGPCKHRACVNPDHLSAVPSGDNTRRGKTAAAVNASKDRCSDGHLFTEANTYIWEGHRQCRMCKLLDHQRRFAERKARAWGLSDVLAD